MATERSLKHTHRRTVPLKVIDQILRPVSDIAVVDRSASSSQEEQSVKSREELSRRLMDRA